MYFCFSQRTVGTSCRSDGRKINLMNKSVLFPIIIGIVLVLVVGGIYTVSKINTLENENQKISEELSKQKNKIGAEKLLETLDDIDNKEIVNDTTTKTNENSDSTESERVVVTEPAYTTPIENDISNTISELYNTVAVKFIPGYISLLESLSKEVQRNMSGIPRNIGQMQMLNIMTHNESTSEKMNEYLKLLSDDYVRSYQEQEDLIDDYIDLLRVQQKTFLQMSDEASRGYVPHSSGQNYITEVEQYNEVNLKTIEDISSSVSVLGDKYLEFKSTIMVKIKSAIEEISSETVSVPPPRSYIPPAIYLPNFNTYRQTYCTTHGNSISCSTY